MDTKTAIEYKRDLSKMKDKYEPAWVEKYWY
jgi:hypothetical protein